MKELKRIGVFCGSSNDATTYYSLASRIGSIVAARNLTLVYGGSESGMMGELALAAKKFGATIIGVVPEMWHSNRQTIGIDECKVAKDIHERKLWMYREADAILVLPGGYGTLDELFEVMCWNAHGLHLKPCCMLNVDGYFDPVLEMMHKIKEAHFAPRDVNPSFVAGTVGEAFDLLAGQFSRLP